MSDTTFTPTELATIRADLADCEREAAEIVELKREHERLKIEIEALKSQRGISALLAADRTQRERELIEETHCLRARLEVAKKVADAAVRYDLAKTNYDVDQAYGTLSGSVVEKMLTAHAEMRTAVREYRALTESPERVEYVSNRLPPESAGGQGSHCSKCGEAVPVTGKEKP